MSDPLVIAFSDVQKVENSGRKLLPMQKTGQIDIEDVVIALKKANGAVERSISNASPFWEIRAWQARTCSTGRRRFDRFRANDKFVKELAEAIPLGEATVFVSDINAGR